MVFHWSASDSKSPQVSRTIFRNPVDLNLDGLYLSSVLQSLYQSFGDHSKCTNYSWYHCNLHVSYFPQSSPIFIPFLPSFNFTLWSAGMVKFTIQQVLYFLLTITRSGCLAKIRGFVCISKSQISLCLIFLDGFWVVHILLVHMVKFRLLAQFPVNYFLYSVMSSLILFLH